MGFLSEIRNILSCLKRLFESEAENNNEILDAKLDRSSEGISNKSKERSDFSSDGSDFSPNNENHQTFHGSKIPELTLNYEDKDFSTIPLN